MNNFTATTVHLVRHNMPLVKDKCVAMMRELMDCQANFFVVTLELVYP